MKAGELNKKLLEALNEEVEFVVVGAENVLRDKLSDKLPEGCRIETYTDNQPAPNNKDGVKVICPEGKEEQVREILKDFSSHKVTEELEDDFDYSDQNDFLTVETVGDKVAKRSRQAIELINQILDYVEETMDPADVKNLEETLYILQNMVPEMQ